jgi:hypothetical protein
MRALFVIAALATPAFAQPKPDALVGAKAVLTAPAPSGFVDDVIAADGDRFGYVIADGTTKAALHVATVGAQDEQIVDLAAVTLQPIAMRFVGPRVFVVGVADGKQVAALVELAGKKPGSTVYKLGPADHITVITRDGKPRVAVHRATTSGAVTKHTTELVAIETGKRVQAGKSLELDATGHDKKLDFRVNHWSDGWTRAYGIKAGEWDKKENERAPDQEGAFDLVTGKVDKKKIEDLFDQKRRFTGLADANGELHFVRTDGKAIQLWIGGAPSNLQLDQAFTDYDPKSLQGIVNADGTGWLVLKVDPVNPDAVKRQKADPEYLDIFKLADKKATRKARVYAKGVRHRFGVAGDRFWLIERNAGFDRGGKTVTLYALQ